MDISFECTVQCMCVRRYICLNKPCLFILHRHCVVSICAYYVCAGGLCTLQCTGTCMYSTCMCKYMSMLHLSGETKPKKPKTKKKKAQDISTSDNTANIFDDPLK